MYKSIVALVFCVFAFPVKADVQIDQANGDVHAPFSLEDFDRENYIKYPGLMPNVQYDGTQSPHVIIKGLFDDTAWDEKITRLMPGQTFWITSATNAYTATQDCTITDVNGDARQAPYWGIQYKRLFDSVEDADLGLKRYRIIVYCYD